MTGVSPTPDALESVAALVAELLFGPAPEASWVLDRTGAGLIEACRAVPRRDAVREIIPGRPSIAGHAAHVRYHLELLVRWAEEGGNPFATADWAGSWRVMLADDPAWSALLADVERGGRRWIEAIRAPREWDAISLTGTIASAAHTAYHLGAVRQLVYLVETSGGEAPGR